MKKVVLHFLFFILCWFVILFMFQWTVLETVNITFMSSLIAVLIVVLMKIFRSGFLTLFIEGFKKIGYSLSSKSHAMERANDQLERDKSLREFKKLTKKWLYDTVFVFFIASFTMSVIGLVIYYNNIL